MAKTKESSKGDPLEVVFENRFIRQRFVQPHLSREQELLQQMFASDQKLWGTGRNLPQMNRSLTSGGGLIKNGDFRKETASMFGIR